METTEIMNKKYEQKTSPRLKLNSFFSPWADAFRLRHRGLLRRVFLRRGKAGAVPVLHGLVFGALDAPGGAALVAVHHKGLIQAVWLRIFWEFSQALTQKKGKDVGFSRFLVRDEDVEIIGLKTCERN